MNKEFIKWLIDRVETKFKHWSDEVELTIANVENRYKKFDDRTKFVLAESYRGKCVDEIADSLGINRATIYKILTGAYRDILYSCSYGEDSVYNLGLGTNVVNALMRAGIKDKEQLLEWYNNPYRNNVRNLGAIGMEKIDKYVKGLKK